MTLLQKLSINLNPIFTIGTTNAARYPLQSFHNYTLKELLEDFNIPFTSERLHVAGNDAHFTLCTQSSTYDCRERRTTRARRGSSMGASV